MLAVIWLQSLHLDSGYGHILLDGGPHFTMMMMMMMMMMSACELVLELIKYDDKDEMLRGLVQLLTPSNDEVERAKANIEQGIVNSRVCLSVCLSLCLSVCVCVSVCPCVCLVERAKANISQGIVVSRVCLSVCLSVCLPVCVSLRVSSVSQSCTK